jgi:hypothetical protein
MLPVRLARVLAAPLGVLLLSLPAALSAQGGRPSQLQVERTAGLSAGVRAVFSADRPDAWGWGAQARLPLDWNISAEPSLDVWSVNGHTWWQANADLLALDRRGWVYGRLGLAVAGHRGADTKYGVNAGLGTDLPYLFETPLRPFAEVRWTVVDGHAPLRLLLGANFTFGKR